MSILDSPLELGSILNYHGPNDGRLLRSVNNKNNLIAKCFKKNKVPDKYIQLEIDAQRKASMIPYDYNISPKIYEILNNENEKCFIMDYIQGLTLNDYLKNNNITSNDAVPSILKEKLYNVLTLLYDNGISHLDIGGGNIIIDSNNDPHIIDFGLSKLYKGSVPLRKRSYNFSVTIGPCRTFENGKLGKYNQKNCYQIYLKDSYWKRIREKFFKKSFGSKRKTSKRKTSKRK